jgi:hypothetical protein
MQDFPCFDFGLEGRKRHKPPDVIKFRLDNGVNTRRASKAFQLMSGSSRLPFI